MKPEQDYTRDIAEIRSMMERSSKFLSLAGWAGVMAGIYALAGAFVAWWMGYPLMDFVHADYGHTLGIDFLWKVFLVAIIVLVLAVGTAILLSARKARKRNEKLWTSTSRQLLGSMAVPLVTGGLFLLILFYHDLFFFWIPGAMVFYGLALYNAGRFTYKEIKALGYIQIILGLLSAASPRYGLICWAIGFGVMHIVYGIYIHNKYER